jgi:hypothetical protein
MPLNWRQHILVLTAEKVTYSETDVKYWIHELPKTAILQKLISLFLQTDP